MSDSFVTIIDGGVTKSTATHIVTIVDSFAPVPGPPGPPGGSILRSTWHYHNNPSPPPGAGEIRTPSPVTAIYVSEIDDQGFNRDAALATPVVGDTLTLKGDDGSVGEVTITAAPIDHDTWWEFPIEMLGGEPDIKKGTEIELQIVHQS